MRKTTITILTFLIVIPAVNCLGFNEKQAKEYLNQPGAVEQFENKENGNSQPKEDETPPLVKQAKQFALYLNPPEPKDPEPKRNSQQKKAQRRRSPAIPDTKKQPERSSVKFDLLGTSHFPANPSLSFALIDSPGKGLRWVKQSSKVGHLEVEEIKNGSIIVKDNQRTEEVFVPQPEKTNLLKDKSGQDNTRKGTSSYQSTVAANNNRRSSARRAPINDTKPQSLGTPSSTESKPDKPSQPKSSIPDSKRTEVANELISQMNALKEKEDSEQAREKEKELIREMFEKLSQASSKNKPASPNAAKKQSSEMNSKELRKLQDMGKELDKNNQPPNPNELKKAREKEKERIRKMFENLENKNPRDPNTSNSGKTRK